MPVCLECLQPDTSGDSNTHKKTDPWFLNTCCLQASQQNSNAISVHVAVFGLSLVYQCYSQHCLIFFILCSDENILN